ncbi:MAG TPA: hypothetical protein VIT91_17180 [Chthoniobacterales bacterium]
MRKLFKIGLAALLVVALFWGIWTLLGTEIKLYQDSVSHSVRADYYKGFFKFRTALWYETEGYSAPNASWTSGVTQAFPKWLSRGDGVFYRKGEDLFLIQLLEVSPDRIEVRIGSLHSDGLNQIITGPIIQLPNGDGVRWSFRDRQSIFIYAGDYLNRAYLDLYEISDPLPGMELPAVSPKTFESLHFSRLPWEQK